jgi:hypothetical protein
MVAWGQRQLRCVPGKMGHAATPPARLSREQRRYDMNANRFFEDSHWLEIWSNHFSLSMGPNGGSVAMDSYSVRSCGDPVAKSGPPWCSAAPLGRTAMANWRSSQTGLAGPAGSQTRGLCRRKITVHAKSGTNAQHHLWEMVAPVAAVAALARRTSFIHLWNHSTGRRTESLNQKDGL